MKSNEEGSTIVEMALASGVLLAALMGVFQASLMLYTNHFLSYAARDGARYAMVRGSNSCWTDGVSTSHITGCNDMTGAGVVGHVESRGVNWITQCVKPCVSVTWPNGTNAPGNPVKVQVSYPYTLYVPWVKPISITLESTSQMIIAN